MSPGLSTGWCGARSLSFALNCQAHILNRTSRSSHRVLQQTPRISANHSLLILTRSTNGSQDGEESSGDEAGFLERLTERIELSAQSLTALLLLGALGLSCVNVLAKVGVITFALVSVAVRYTIVGILLVILVALVI
jgi:hypothetical protein